tara:strand:+ start:1402 stop:1575 length:174 start_codon:yes stop_codon:yes gene_type:complete
MDDGFSPYLVQQNAGIRCHWRDLKSWCKTILEQAINKGFSTLISSPVPDSLLEAKGD